MVTEVAWHVQPCSAFGFEMFKYVRHPNPIAWVPVCHFLGAFGVTGGGAMRCLRSRVCSTAHDCSGRDAPAMNT